MPKRLQLKLLGGLRVAIAKMQKLNLVAMSYDKDAILNALQRTGAVEVVTRTEAEQTIPTASYE